MFQPTPTILNQLHFWGKKAAYLDCLSTPKQQHIPRNKENYAPTYLWGSLAKIAMCILSTSSFIYSDYCVLHWLKPLQD